MERVAVTGISKRYGEQLALDGVSFSIQRGEILGLIGPNGAGKTTIMYRRTALSPDTQPFIRRFADRFLQERVNWENAVNHYLETGQPLVFK